MLQNEAACYIFERLHHCAFIKFSTDWKITFYYSHKQVWKVVCFFTPRNPRFALLCFHNCSVSALEVCIVRPSFLHQWHITAVTEVQFRVKAIQSMLPFIWKKFNAGIFCAWYCQVPRSLILISKAFKLTHKALCQCFH